MITLLIIDDSEIDCAIYTRYLQTDERDYRILNTNSLETGLKLWHSERPDIVLLDWFLPDGDGSEFLEAIRPERTNGQIPVIVVTGQGREREAVRAMKLGAADYLVKGEVTAVSLRSVIWQVREREVLEQQLVRSRQQAEIVAEIALRIRQSLNLEEVLTAIVREVRHFLHTDRVIIYQFNADMSGTIVAESVDDSWMSSLNADIVDTCFQQNAGGDYRAGKIFVADDIYSANLTPCHLELLEQFQVRANLVVPILLSQDPTDCLWGLLIAHHCQGSRHWEEMDLQLLQELSVQSAIAIQQANLYRDLQSLNATLEQKVKERTEELTRANLLKDDFLSNMSHELRTPLNAILGMSEALLDEVLGSLNERQHKSIATIEKSGRHLLELINDLLDLAKISAGKMELHPTLVSIENLCESSLLLVQQQAFLKRISIDKHIPEGTRWLTVDERRIRQVLINLLGNAVKFTPEGGRVRLSVVICSPETCNDSSAIPNCLKNTDSPLILFQITDTGIGIAPDELKRLFQPFVQLDSNLNRQYTGTGLGLAIVKRITELHGGRIVVQSELGRGTCFTVALPYENSLMVPAPGEASLMTTVKTNLLSSTVSPLILVAEDNEYNISTVSNYLTACGYSLIFAKNGEEAVALTRERQPNIVLMDIQMPRMDGLEAIRLLRADDRTATIPIIVLSALAMPGDRERCFAAGANQYFSKPFRMKQLVEVIKQVYWENPSGEYGKS